MPFSPGGGPGVPTPPPWVPSIVNPPPPTEVSLYNQSGFALPTGLPAPFDTLQPGTAVNIPSSSMTPLIWSYINSGATPFVEYSVVKGVPNQASVQGYILVTAVSTSNNVQPQVSVTGTANGPFSGSINFQSTGGGKYLGFMTFPVVPQNISIGTMEFIFSVGTVGFGSGTDSIDYHISVFLFFEVVNATIDEFGRFLFTYHAVHADPLYNFRFYTLIQPTVTIQDGTFPTIWYSQGVSFTIFESDDINTNDPIAASATLRASFSGQGVGNWTSYGPSTPPYDPWDVFFDYPQPADINCGAIGGASIVGAYEFGANNPPPPPPNLHGVTTPFPDVPWTDGSILSASASVGIQPPFGYTVTSPSGGSVSAPGYTAPAARDLGYSFTPPYNIVHANSLSGTTITASCVAYPVSGFKWCYQPPLLGISVFAEMSGQVTIPGTVVSLDLSTVQMTGPVPGTQTNVTWVFDAIQSSSGGGTFPVNVSFTMKPKPS